jgi:hypothetical protein
MVSKKKLLLAGLIFLAGCSKGSNSGGNHNPLKAICQACTYNNECESDRCVKFKSGIYRCTPQRVTTYTCPTGMYKTFDGNQDSCL